jgi:hypothetical protein
MAAVAGVPVECLGPSGLTQALQLQDSQLGHQKGWQSPLQDILHRQAIAAVLMWLL